MPPARLIWRRNAATQVHVNDPIADAVFASFVAPEPRLQDTTAPPRVRGVYPERHAPGTREPDPADKRAVRIYERSLLNGRVIRPYTMTYEHQLKCRDENLPSTCKGLVVEVTKNDTLNRAYVGFMRMNVPGPATEEEETINGYRLRLIGKSKQYIKNKLVDIKI